MAGSVKQDTGTKTQFCEIADVHTRYALALRVRYRHWISEVDGIEPTGSVSPPAAHGRVFKNAWHVPWVGTVVGVSEPFLRFL